MLRILQISITLIFVIICTTTAQTTEEITEAPLAPRCEGDICYCINGTHEAFFKGRKYCAPDSTEPCPDHAIRISTEVCECKNGYRFLNDDRTVCVPEHMEETTTTTTSEYSPDTSTEPCPDHAIRLSAKVCECKNGYRFLNDDRTVCVLERMEETTTTTAKIITTTTTITTNPSEIPCNTLYIYVGIAVLIITAFILIVLLCLLLKR